MTSVKYGASCSGKTKSCCRGDIIFFFVDKADSLTSIAIPETITASAVIDGRLLWTSSDGISELSHGRIRLLEGTETLRQYAVRALLSYNGQLIIATTQHGLLVYDGHDMKPFLPQLTPFLTENQLFCADLQGSLLAIGTVRKGLLLYNIATGQTQYANRDTGLQNNTVLSLHFDELQNIWLGLDQGLSYVMPSFPSSYLLEKNSPIGAGYTSLITPTRLYLGSNQGVFAIPYPLRSEPEPPTPQLVGQLTGQAWELSQVDGVLLCGCDAGAYVINGMNAQRIEGPDGTWHFLQLSRHPGLVLASDYSGFYLLRRQGTTYRFDGRLKGFDETSNDFQEADDGSIWVSHWQKGVYRLTLDADGHGVADVKLFNSAHGLIVDRDNLLCKIDGNVYISSVDGLYSYDAATGQLKHADQLNKIFQNFGVSLHISETPEKDLWAYKPGYLAIAHPKGDGTYLVDSTSYKNVARDLQMSFGRPAFTNAGQTIMNSHSGFFFVENFFKAQTTPQRIILQGIVGTNHGDTILYACTPRPEETVYTVNHADNSLRFSFVMPEYSRPHEIFYECILEGYDKKWVTLGNIGEKEYTQLPKGNYTFRIKARNNITGTTDECAISVEVLPAWHETWWARLLQVLLMAVAVWLVIVCIKRKENRRIALLKQENEREMQRQQERNDLEMKAQQAQFEMEQQQMLVRQQQMEMDRQRLEMEQQKREGELNRLKNEQLETELKHRQSELGDSTMNLMRKNDMLQALDAQLDELSESVRREDAKAKITQKIKDIRRDVQNNINEDEGWDKFEENFNLVYEDFMKRLTKAFPDLKMNDRKLCAYLRMGLSSKEMASLLNTSVRSIETARYRLRKKLGMEQGDNLTEFIQSFGD